MKDDIEDDIVVWSILLTVLAALGFAMIGFYMYMDEVLKGLFFT